MGLTIDDDRYGKVVRTAPNTVMCCDKEDVWKVLVEKDCLKDDSYALLRKERDVSNVFNELERGRHRVTVSSSFPCLLYSTVLMFLILFSERARVRVTWVKANKYRGD